MVSPKEPILAERLLKGLSSIQESGEFDRLFNVYIQPELDVLELEHRRVIHLH